MKTFAAGALFVLALLLANVVAAGVFAVLGPIVLDIEDQGARLLGVVLVGVVSIGCALLFLKGSLFYAIERFSLVQTNPHKGLESGSGRRGG